LAAELPEILQTIAEKIVSRDDDQIIVDIFLGDDEMQVANRTELIRVVG